METIFKSSLGVQMDSFLREYGARLKNKHILYAVSTNLAEDREISRSTRGRLGGVNIKIGKSTGNPYARLKAYTNMASNYKSQFPQSGVRVLFVRTYPKRKESQSGKPIVEVVETLLKRALRADNRKVPRRGEEKTSSSSRGLMRDPRVTRIGVESADASGISTVGSCGTSVG